MGKRVGIWIYIFHIYFWQIIAYFFMYGKMDKHSLPRNSDLVHANASFHWHIPCKKHMKLNKFYDPKFHIKHYYNSLDYIIYNWKKDSMTTKSCSLVYSNERDENNWVLYLFFYMKNTTSHFAKVMHTYTCLKIDIYYEPHFLGLKLVNIYINLSPWRNNFIWLDVSNFSFSHLYHYLMRGFI